LCLIQRWRPRYDSEDRWRWAKHFPDIEDLDARDAGRNVEVFLDVRIEGKPTPVTVKLSYEQASDLAAGIYDRATYANGGAGALGAITLG
jgi:hypothetical protein